MQVDATALMLPLLLEFVKTFAPCFTSRGLVHFQYFILAHCGLHGLPHCVTETMRLTRIHKLMHWTTPYAFMNRGVWSCQFVCQCLLNLIVSSLGVHHEIIVAVDDTLVKKRGRNFFGLGRYKDPTDKNPGSHKRKVWGHCWVTIALIWECGPGQWFGFPLAALLFVPQYGCPEDFPFMTKIELSVMLIKRMRWNAQRLVIVADNLYAKASLRDLAVEGADCFLVSRLRSNAALFEPPAKRKKNKRGRPAKRGGQVKAERLYQRKSKRRKLSVNIYGKVVLIDAFVDILIPSRTLGDKPILAVIFPQRSGQKMNIFFTTDLNMSAERLLEIYAGRFKIEDIFDEIKNMGGFGDYRQRSFKAIKRHATLCIVAYSLLRLVSVTLAKASSIEAEPWWSPAGPPSVTRLRRSVYQSLRISRSLHSGSKVKEIAPLKEAA